MTPKISILLPAPKGEAAPQRPKSGSVRTAANGLRFWCSVRPPGPDERARASLPAGQIVVPVGAASLHDARAIGVAHASGEYVMLAEDHCVPEPGWATAILGRIDEGWDGVGAALRAGDLRSRWAEASFLIGYGEWMMPVESGPTAVLCGLNGTIRTDLMRAFGVRLRDELVIGAFLVRHLREQGCRFYLEARAGMRHSTDRFACRVGTRRWDWALAPSARSHGPGPRGCSICWPHRPLRSSTPSARSCTTVASEPWLACVERPHCVRWVWHQPGRSEKRLARRWAWRASSIPCGGPRHGPSVVKPLRALSRDERFPNRHDQARGPFCDAKAGVRLGPLQQH